MSSRSEIVNRIAEDLDITKKLADHVLLTVTAALQAQLDNKGQAVLPTWGRFKVVDRSARQGRNPRTGVAIDIPAKQVVKFKTF